MPKLTSQRKQAVKDLVNRNRDHMTGLHNTSHVRFLDTAPVFVTLYTQNMVETTSAIGFKDSYKDTGSNSPIRYDKVNNFPIFISEKVSRATEKDEEIGWGEIMNSSAITLPRTVDLKKGDLFVVNYNSTEAWFSISNAPSVTKVKSNDYQAFEFELKRTPVESGYTTDTVIDPDQVVEEFECLFDNIGTEYKAIIRKTESEMISTLLNKADEINNLIMDEAYYNNAYRRNLLLVESDRGEVTYVHPLTIFAHKNEVLSIGDNSWMMNSNDVKDTRGSLRTYTDSIFNGIVTRDTSKVGITFQLKDNNPNEMYFSALNNVIDCISCEVIGNDGTDINVLDDDVFDNIADSALDTAGYSCILKHMRKETLTTSDLADISIDVSSVIGLVRSMLILYVIQTQAQELMFDNTLERVI